MNYNRLTDNTEKKAFSLAEALITLLIICIVVALTVNSMSKSSKFKNKNQKQNIWFCYRDTTGAYQVGGSLENGQPTDAGTANGTHCTFKPPKGVSQFYVTAIGGGGGGASGSSSSIKAETREGYARFVPPVTGPYYVVVVGGGGGSGGNNCGGMLSIGGGSGGVYAGVIELTQGVTYGMFAGNGGNGGKKAKTGDKGGLSYFAGPGIGRIEAGGGEAGAGRYQKIFNRCRDGYGTGNGGTCSPSGGNCTNGNRERSRGGGGEIPNGVWIALRLGINSTEIYANIGRGGEGVYDENGGQTGKPGLVKVVYSPIFSGGGGKSGLQSYYVYKRSPGETKVTVGEAGKGGVDDNQAGTAGGSSSFGDRVLAAGGAGGEPRYQNATLDSPTPKAVGGEGGGTTAPRDLEKYGFDFSGVPYGGLQEPNYEVKGLNVKSPGSGGGGGGTSYGTSGDGADGAPGIVIVSW